MAGMERTAMLLLFLFATSLLVASAWDIEDNMPRRMSLKGEIFASNVEFQSRRKTFATASRAAGGCNIYDGQFVYDNATRPAYDNKNCPHFDVRVFSGAFVLPCAHIFTIKYRVKSTSSTRVHTCWTTMYSRSCMGTVYIKTFYFLEFLSAPVGNSTWRLSENLTSLSCVASCFLISFSRRNWRTCSTA